MTRGGRLGGLLLVAALCVVVSAALHNVTAPWERGMRGIGGAQFSDGAVTHTLRYGLTHTLGMPAFLTEVDGELVREVNWHHPPGYWLYLSGAAWLFGHERWVLRCAHLLLVLPGVVGLWLLVRRAVGATTAGVATLLFVAAPMVGYFMPMVLQDGATLSFGLCTIAAFARHLERRTWGSWMLVAVTFFVACSIDHPGHLWGLAMFALACSETRGRRLSAMCSVLSFLPVSIAAFALMAWHYGMLFEDGAVGFVRELLSAMVADKHQGEITSARVAGALHDEFVTHGNWPIWATGLLGVVLALLVRSSAARALLRLGVVLVVPGLFVWSTQFRHALDHVFWGLPGYGAPGVCTAAVAVVGWRCWSAGRRAAGASLLAVVASVFGHGVIWTHVLVERFECIDNGTGALLTRAQPGYCGCSRGLTSAPRTTQAFFGGTHFFFEIGTPQQVDIALALGRRANVQGDVVFVVDPADVHSDLTRHLDGMAERRVVEGIWVYRLRL